MRKFLRGFMYAANGMRSASAERNMRIHYMVALFVIIAGYVFGISKLEWMACLLSISLIFALETVNTAIERLCNRITLENDNSIKEIKDIAAGAVLLAAIGVTVVGLIVFVPYIIELFK